MGNPSNVSDNVFNILHSQIQHQTSHGQVKVVTNLMELIQIQETFLRHLLSKLNIQTLKDDVSLEGYPKLYIKKGGLSVSESPFTMNEVVLKNTGKSGYSSNQKNPNDIATKKIGINDTKLMSKNKLAKDKDEGVIKSSPSQLNDDHKSLKISDSPSILDGVIYCPWI